MKSEGILKKLLRKKTSSEDDGSYQSLNLEKQDMIRGIVELSETTVKEVMVPRIDVAFVSADLDTHELLEKVIAGGHSRFPVYKDTIDNVIGVIYAKDLLRALIADNRIDIEQTVRKPFFVPESKRLDSLLREMRRRRVHIAVAVDEYGGVSGIVCLEDIIEEIVGDIQDEFDNEKEDVLEIGEGVYLVDARTNIEDLNDELKSEIPDDDFETLGGYVFDLFGKIPVKFEKVTHKDMDFIIQEMDGHKIKTVKIVLRRPEQEKERERAQ